MGAHVKRQHFASKVNEDGGVSALCFTTLRSINLRRASWTIRPLAVTCPKCKRLMNRLAELRSMHVKTLEQVRQGLTMPAFPEQD